MLTVQEKEQIKATVPVLRENGVALTDYFYKRMLKNNPQLKETFNVGNQRSGAQAKALAGAVLAYAENIDDPMVLAPVVEMICHKHVSLNIQAPDYNIVGENLLYSISEVLDIPMDNPLISAWGKAYQQLADLFIATEKSLYANHAQTEGSWLGWRNFIVDRKVKESDEITSFYLIPEDAQALPTYKAGQYISLRILVPELGIKQPRQYSLSDSPSGNYLRISVKNETPRLEGQDPGYVSSTLHNRVEQGDTVELTAPTGNFFLINPDKTNVLISAGVGLTPMVAMLKQLVAEKTITSDAMASVDNTDHAALDSNGSKKPLYFIHAARSAEVHAMRNEINALREKNNHLHVYYAYEQITEADALGRDYHQQGRLDLNQLPAEYLPKEADYYLCGPVPFMHQQKKALLEKGIPEAHIHSEAFATGGV
ncbi:globin domain-containing protein [Rouxiella sp. T17]|uniref:globin domain-containing protein n=1 Tax=Rouxiella sp. T17 TaxID=3085684 RepID=UPI002FC5BB9B